MTTENIDIRIREDGAVVAKKNIQGIAPAARESADAVDFLKKALVGLGGALAVREILRLLDTFTNLQNRLGSTGIEGKNLTAVYEELLKVSNQTRSSVEGSVELYSRLALSSKELGVSQQQVIEFTKSLNQAIILSGASAQEAQAGLIQLSQGLASGTLRGDELRSVLEQLPAVADVIAKSLKVTRGELRQLGADGKITAGAVLKAFQEARQELDDRFGRTVPTLSQSFQVLKNNLLDFFGKLDAQTGTSRALSAALFAVAQNLDLIAKSAAAALAGLVLIGGAQLLIRGVVGAVVALNAAIAANPIAAILIVIVSAVTALVLFSDKIKLGIDGITTLEDLFTVLGRTIKTVFDDVAVVAQAAFGPLIDSAKEWLKTVDFSVIGILRAVAKGVDFFVGAWRGAVNAVLALMEGVPPAVSDIFTRALNFILDKIGSFVNAAGKLLNSVTEFAGLGTIVNANLNLKLTNENEGAAKRLGSDVASAFQDGFKQSTGAQDFLKRIEAEAAAVALARREKERFDRQAKGAVSTQAGPAAPIKLDPKEILKAENALRALLNTIQPSTGAVLELAKAERVLNDAVKFGLITRNQANYYLEIAKQHYEEIIDPLKKINREITEQTQLLQFNSRERQVETDLLGHINDLKSKGEKLSATEIDTLRARLQGLRDLNESTKAQDQLLANSVEQRRQFTVQLVALQKLLADPSSGFTKGDAATQITSLLPPEVLQGTQVQIEAQVQAFTDMYARIDALRQADLISEQTAQQARSQVAVQEQAFRLKDQQDFFGNLAKLSSSGNKRIAAVGKAAAITQATIDGVLAVQKALASAPPPVNYALAAAVGAAAAANIAQIANAGSGFMTGGYTGDDAKTKAVGFVHGQEFVVNADGTKRNRLALEAMNKGYDMRAAQAGAATQGNATSDSGTGADSSKGPRIINVLDPALVADYLATEPGEQVLVNVIRRNSDSIRSAISNG